MREAIDAILRRYGCRMNVVRNGKTRAVRAFLQPVTEKGRQEAMRTIAELGELPAQRYVYIGPAEPVLGADDAVCFRERIYRVCRAELLCMDDRAMYVWALLRPAEAEGVWKS